MVLDHRLHRLGAGMRGLLAHQCGADAQRKAGEPPDRRHQGGPHLPLREDLVEAGKVRGLVRLVLLQLPGDAVLAGGGVQHRALAAVDVHRRQLARVVDAQHLRQARLARAKAGAGRDRTGHGRFPMMAAAALQMASFSEISTFSPAMVINPGSGQ
jgi:hypothetical protein